jgi:type II secretion system protein J
MKNISKKNGYSLVEMIVYLAIFSIVSIAVINSFIVVMSSFSVTRTNRDLLESGSSAMERISREIRQAVNIDIANSTLGTSTGILQLNSTDSGGDPVIIKFSVTNGALNIYQGGVLTGSLLGQNIIVTNLIFRRIDTTLGEAVKVEMSLQDINSKTLRIEKFYSTIILRGIY